MATVCIAVTALAERGTACIMRVHNVRMCHETLDTVESCLDLDYTLRLKK